MQPVPSDFTLSQSEDALYPSSDGQPMAETELHADEMTELKLMLRRHFREQAGELYVGCNLFVYYERGNPRAVFSPDVFVVRGAPQLQYDTYKLWKDGPAPCFAIEVTSKSTRLEDKGNKKAVCELLGVREYFLYDPRAEYLEPPLQGFRLSGRQYEPIVVDDHGSLPSETLGVTLSLDSTGRIVLRDGQNGERLLRVDEERLHLESAKEHAEAARERAEAERDRERAERDEARKRASEAEARLAAALQELERLKL